MRLFVIIVIIVITALTPLYAYAFTDHMCVSKCTMTGIAYPLCVDRCSTHEQQQPAPAPLNLPPWDTSYKDVSKEVEKNRQMQLQNEMQQEQLNQMRSSNRPQQVDMDRLRVIYNRGVSFLSINKFDLAVAEFDKVLNIIPNQVGALASRGVAYFHLGKYELAFVDLDQAIIIDPKVAFAYDYRARVYVTLKKYKEACDDLKEACSLGECETYEKAKEHKACK